MEIGKLLKQYRKDMQLTQQVMAGNIMTPSYYAKIEKGHHRITAEDLFAILDHIGADKEKFILDLEKEPKERIYNKFIGKINHSTLIEDQEDLFQIREEITHNKVLSTRQKNDLRILINIHLNRLTKTNHYLSEQDIQYIHDKILDLEIWNTYKLSLYANMINVFSLETNNIYINSIISKTNYTNTQKKIIFDIMLKHISSCISNNYDSLAQYYMEYLAKEKTTTENLFERLLYEYYVLILKYRHAPSQEIESNIKKIIDVYSIVNIKSFGENLEKFFEFTCLKANR